ncbi:MAG: dynamin family protein [Candidatus Kariarchaeaceae archaeon]
MSFQKQVSLALSEASETLIKFPDLQSQIEEFQKYLSRPLRVAIVGEYSSGKSTFLNVLLEENLLPTGNLPTTGCVNFIRFGNFSIVAHYKNESSRTLTAKELKTLSTHKHVSAARNRLLQRLKYIEIFKPIKILKKTVFIDTPGLNAPTELDRCITERLLNKADAIIWVTSAQKVLAASEIEVLKTFSKRYRHKSLCVISQIDTLSYPDKEVPLLLEYAHDILSDYFMDIVAISAKKAIEGEMNYMQPFFKSFWDCVVPESHKMVLQTLLFDASEIVTHKINEVSQEKQNCIQLQENLNCLEQDIQNVMDTLLNQMQRLTEDFRRELRLLQEQLITQIQRELTTWTDYEPYTRTITGFFTDSYVVDHKEVQRWEWPEEPAKKTHESVIKNVENLVNKFIENTNTLLGDADNKRDILNNAFKEKQRERLERFFVFNVKVQELMIETEFTNFFYFPYWYFMGAMSHAGVWQVAVLLSFDKSVTRPTEERIRQLVEEILPLKRLEEYYEDNVEFKKSVREAAKVCYEWLDKDILEKIMYFDTLTKELELSKEQLLIDVSK